MCNQQTLKNKLDLEKHMLFQKEECISVETNKALAKKENQADLAQAVIQKTTCDILVIMFQMEESN